MQNLFTQTADEEIKKADFIKDNDKINRDAEKEETAKM